MSNSDNALLGKWDTRTVENCGVCSARVMSELWHLPRYPITEAFGPFSPTYPALNQSLVRCNRCGHVQLLEQISTSFLYSEANYSFAPHGGQKYVREYDFLEAFIRAVLPTPQCELVLEFGANNLSFSTRLVSLGRTVVVCDPFLPQIDKAQDNLVLIRRPIEEALASGLVGRPNLIVARHTLEHIGEPANLLRQLLEAADDSAIFVFEVPSLEHLVAKYRFDAITHQHVHYFTRESVTRMAEEVGAQIIDLGFNHRGSNGGSLLFALSKASSASKSSRRDLLVAERRHLSLEDIQAAISMFRKQMRNQCESVAWDSATTFGFGASLMLATLDYHLAGNISRLDVVFDDDPQRSGTSYRNVDVSVLSPDDVRFRPSSTFVVTSWENSRAIYRRLTELDVTRIVTPIVT